MDLPPPGSLRPTLGVLLLPALLALGGCWPMIPGPLDDYAIDGRNGNGNGSGNGNGNGNGNGSGYDVDDIRVFGWFSRREAVGDYWRTPTAASGAAVGVLDPPQRGYDATSLLLPPGVACGEGPLPFDLPATSSLTTFDAPPVFDTPGGTLTLDWNSDLHLYALGGWGWQHASPLMPLALRPNAVGGVPLEVKDAGHFPRELLASGPPLDGWEPAWASAEDLLWTWDASLQADYVVLQVQLLVHADLWELRWCAVPATAGSVAIPADSWTLLAEGQLWYVWLYTVNSFHVPMDGIDEGASFTYWKGLLGALWKE